jgi:hypothetical protein
MTDLLTVVTDCNLSRFFPGFLIGRRLIQVARFWSPEGVAILLKTPIHRVVPTYMRVKFVQNSPAALRRTRAQNIKWVEP